MTWHDEIVESVNELIDQFNGTGQSMVEYFNFLFAERSQLYGTVAYLMKKYGDESVIITMEDRREISTQDAVYFIPTQGGGLKVELRKQESNEPLLHKPSGE